MNKKAIIFIVIILLLALGFAGFWMMNRTMTPALEEETPLSAGLEAVSTAQNAAGDSMDKTNPFSADVNPMNGYTNPFE